MESREKVGDRRAGSLIRAAGRGAMEVVKSLDPRNPRLEINETNVARTISSHLYNPVLERMGKDKWANGFTAVDVLRNMGRIALLNSADYRGRFYDSRNEDERNKAVVVLRDLADAGVLKHEKDLKPDINKEVDFYRVIDETKLKEIAQSAGSK